MRTKVVDPEGGTIKPVEKPTIEQVQWWQSSLPEDPKHPEGSRIERLKPALGRKQGKPVLPLQNHNDSSPYPSEIIAPHRIPRSQNPDVHNGKRNIPPRKPSGQVPTPPHAYGLPSQPRLPRMAVVAPDSRPMKGDESSSPRPPESSKTQLSRFGPRHPFVDAKVSNANAINRPLESSSNLDTVRPELRPLPQVPRRQIQNDACKVRVVDPPF